MRETRDKFMTPKLGLINEDGGEDFDGTFKEYKGNGNNNNNGIKMPNDYRRYDSLLDSASFVMD